MKINEVKKTVEQVVRTEYIAEDGEVFCSESECRQYEESALFAVSKTLKKINKEFLSVLDLLGEGNDDDEVEIFDIQTEKDLENLRRYCYLKATKHGATESSIKDCFTSVNGCRKDYVFDGITVGHEVIICWSFDKDQFWVHRDGSVNGYLEYLKDKMTKLIKPEEEA